MRRAAGDRRRWGDSGRVRRSSSRPGWRPLLASADWADRLDILVCNAGLIVPGTVATADPDDLTTQIDVMPSFPIQLIAAAVPAMTARGRGHILATVSMGGIISLPGSAAYSAAKAGPRSFLTALSAELAGTGVHVAGIYPSGVDTPMLRLEARHGGSMLNWVGTIYTVADVVRAYERALTGSRFEVTCRTRTASRPRGRVHPRLIEPVDPAVRAGRPAGAREVSVPDRSRGRCGSRAVRSLGRAGTPSSPST